MSDIPFEKIALMPKPITRPDKAPEGMRKFTIARVNDQSGVSGTGVIAQGVLFATGDIAIQWLTPPPDGDLQIKRSLKSFLDVHVHTHPENITIITWETGEQERYPEKNEREEEKTEAPNGE
jgi:hypothetical protein